MLYSWLDWEEEQNPPFSTVVVLFPPAACIVYVALFKKPFIPTSCEKVMVPAACLQPTAYSCSVTWFLLFLLGESCL